MYMRLKHLWSAPAQHAGIVCIPSATRPRRAAYFSDGTTRGSRSWPPRWPRGAVFALLKTRNQLRGTCAIRPHHIGTLAVHTNAQY
jgi:hypothetical protein